MKNRHTQSSRTAVITGAGRGIGLELTRLLSENEYTLYAGYRDPQRAAELLELAQENPVVRPIELDVADEVSVRQATRRINSELGRLDLLVNNAGILKKPGGALSDYSGEDLLEHFRVNTVGAHLVTEALAGLFGEGAKIVNISSEMGSISGASNTTAPYRISKTALNMLTKLQAQNYRRRGVVSVCTHPGWVKTPMGGAGAPLTAEESAVRLLRFIDRLSQKDSGKFLTVGGAPIPY